MITEDAIWNIAETARQATLEKAEPIASAAKMAAELAVAVVTQTFRRRDDTRRSSGPHLTRNGDGHSETLGPCADCRGILSRLSPLSAS